MHNSTLLTTQLLITLINPLSLPSASFGKTQCFQLRANGPGTPLGPKGTSSTRITRLSSLTRGSLWSLWATGALSSRRTCFTFVYIHVDSLVHEVYYFQVIPQHPLDPRVPGFQGVLQKPFFKGLLRDALNEEKEKCIVYCFGITVETRFTDICYGYLSITDINADN